MQTSEPENFDGKPSQSRRRQFGLKHLLLLTLLVAVGIVGWQKLVYVHPAHRNVSYEKAPYVRSGQVDLKHCRIAIESVARSDRNGTVLVEDGFGNATKVPQDNAKVLKKSGSWLDTAQIQLSAGGGSFEVLEARVFDFETRQIIDKFEPYSGQRMSGPMTLQFSRLGSKLPDRVDVFFRVLVRGKDNKPTRLQPQVGATCKLPGGTLEIAELHRGMKGYTMEAGVLADPSEANNEVAVMLRFDGFWPRENKYMIVAVKKDGTRIHRDSFVRFPGSYLIGKGAKRSFSSVDESQRGELVTLAAGLDDISHFELRPLDGQHVFFFEGVKLPKTSPAKFGVPPVAKVQIGGVETVVKVPEFEPLEVWVTTMKGDAVSGTKGNSRMMSVSLNPGGPKDIETKSTIVDFVQGLSKADTNLIVNPGAGQMKSNQHGSMYGAGRHLRHSVVPLPIEEIDSVRIQMPKP